MWIYGDFISDFVYLYHILIPLGLPVSDISFPKYADELQET